VLPVFLTASYSGPNYQRPFSVDALKIDQPFVNPMTSNPDDATAVRSAIRIGISLKLCASPYRRLWATRLAFLHSNP